MSEAAPILRGDGGRFLPGGPGGPGNPHAKTIGAYRAAIMQAVSSESFARVWKRLETRSLNSALSEAVHPSQQTNTTAKPTTTHRAILIIRLIVG